MIRPNTFIAFNKYDNNIYLISSDLDLTLILTKFEAIILKTLKESISLEAFYKSEKYKELINKSPANKVRIEKFIKRLIEKGVFGQLSDKQKFQLEVVFSDNHKNSYSLSYEIFDTEIAEKWIVLLNQQVRISNEIMGEGLFYSKDFHTREELQNDLIQYGQKIREYLQNKPEIISNDKLIENYDLTSKNLNDLHLIFELAYEKVEDENIRSILRKFNMTIHLCEELISENQGVLIESVFPQALGPIKLTPSDIENFSTDLKYGYLYLNYLQIGHSAIGAFECDSDSVPFKQEFFNSNFFQCFRPNYKFNKLAELEEWMKRKFSLSLKAENWCLGHIPLGKLKDSSFLEYSELKEILKKYNRITDFKITTSKAH